MWACASKRFAAHKQETNAINFLYIHDNDQYQ